MDAQAWDERYAATDLVWSSGPNVFVEELTAGLEPGSALDVAAGEGRNGLWLAERGWTVTATDFSEVGVERARAIAEQRLGDALPRFRALVADALDPAPAPRDGGGYDLVLLAYLQLPDPEWHRALGRAVDAAAPGGHVLVVCHAERNLSEGVGGPQDASVLHDPDAVVAALADLPVDVVDADVRRRRVEGADRPALDTVVLARRR